MPKKPGLPSNSRRSSSARLKPITSCPMCHATYKPAEARILDETNGRHLLHIECKKCGNSVLALVTAGERGISSIGLITDLTASDTLRFKDSFGVVIDDVIGIHELLNEGRNFISELKNK